MSNIYDDAYGSSKRPVRLDPFARIDEVNFVAWADMVIIRTGVGLPSNTGGTPHWPCGFKRITPGKRTDITTEPIFGDEQYHATLEPIWVGKVIPPSFLEGNPEDRSYRNEPLETGGGNAIEITGGPAFDPEFPLRVPSFEEFGTREDGFNPGSYLWATGWDHGVGNPNVDCCIINCRKLRYDFMVRKDPEADPDTPEGKDKKLTTMSVGLAFNATDTSEGVSAGPILAEFAAYRFVPGSTSNGDFITMVNGYVYANDVRKIARKVVKVADPEGPTLRTIQFTYNLRKVITHDSGEAYTDAQVEAMGFNNQIGG